MAHHLMRRHLSPTTHAFRAHPSQPLEDVDYVTLLRQRLHLPSPAEQQTVAAGVAERGERPLTARFRFCEDCLEHGIVPQRIEVPAAGKSRRDEVTFGNGSPEIPEALFVLADIAEQPTFLKDRLRIELNVQATDAETREADEHV